MKVLLVNPPFPGFYQEKVPPLGLGYIGASLVKSGYEVKLIDLALKVSSDLQAEIDFFNPDVVAITGLSPQYPGMKECARVAKELGKLVIVGGLHVSAFPDYVLNDCNSIDIVVKGEGERVFPEFLQRGKATGLAGFYYRNSGSVVGSFQTYICDLSSLPHPWTFLNLSNYDGNMVNGILKPRGRQAVSVLSSRGCPYMCSFCSASQAMGRQIRLRSVGDIISELKELKSQGVEEVQFMDDNFTFYNKHAESICDAIISEELNIYWTLPNGIRADRVSPSLLEKMRDAGCYYFGVGIESGSEKVLERMHKKLSLDKAKETISECDRLGLITQGFILVGYPGETKKDLRDTLNYIKSSKLDRISINQVMLYPGSEIFKEICDPKTIDWSSLHRYKFNTSLPKYTGWYSKYMYLRFYLDPIRLLRHVRKFKTRNQWASLFGGLKTLISEVGR